MDAPSCRFCLEEATEHNVLIAPCDCVGSIEFVHSKCLIRWQTVAPPQFMRRCQLCLTYYKNFVILLETIPNETGILYQFLVCPYLFTFFFKYVLFLYSGLLNSRYTYAIDIIDWYQYSIHFTYFFCFVQTARINNKRVYFKQFLKPHRILVYLFHFYFYIFALHNENLILLYLVDIFLPCYWHFHIKSLQEVNELMQ
jgi:hypothetical protein